MANKWGDLPIEMAGKIAEHLEFYDDYETFGQVCCGWRLATKQTQHKYRNKTNTQPPLLMLADPDDCPYRRFYSLTKQMVLKVDLPPLVLGPDKEDQTKRYFSSRGWLITVSQNNRRITLFNPFSRVVIVPPAFPLEQMVIAQGRWEDWMLVGYFSKFVLSAPPTLANDDYTVAMIYDGSHSVAFWRPGQDRWVVPFLSTGWCVDICFFQGKLYAIDDLSKLMVFRDESLVVVVDLRALGLIPTFDNDKLYLVESESEAGKPCLLVVHRKSILTKTLNYGTKSFRVFEVDVDNGEVKEVRTLHDKAIFVGFNSSFTVLASSDDERGCTPDCIYFTDDNDASYSTSKEVTLGGGKDMGIYSLPLAKRIHYEHLHRYDGPSRYSFLNPPTWVEFFGI